MPKVTKPGDGEDGTGSQGIWLKPMWPSGSPSVRIVMSGTWGGGPGMGGDPARAPGPPQSQCHPASGAASRGGSNANPTDPGDPCLERQPQAPKAYTPRLQKLPALRTPSPHLGSEHWSSSQGQILQQRLLGRMARTSGQAGDQRRQGRRSGPPSITLHRVTSDKKNLSVGTHSFLICQTRERTHIHRP